MVFSKWGFAFIGFAFIGVLVYKINIMKKFSKFPKSLALTVSKV
jgi:hypothetical protein